MEDSIAPEEAQSSNSSGEDVNPTPPDQEDSPAPEPDKAVEAEAPDSPPEPADSDSEARKPRAQERIEQLSAEKRAALEAAEYWRQKALEEVAPKEPLKEDSRPTLEQFEFDQDKFAEALTDWTGREVERQTVSQVAKALEGQQAKSEKDAIREKWLERSATFSVDHPDFQAVAYAPTVPISEQMFTVMQELDKGPEIAYHLGKNVDKAMRISRMRPAAQAAAIGRLEAELSKPAPKPQPSKAPDPPDPVGGAQPTVDISKLPINDWMKARTEELRAKGRR